MSAPYGGFVPAVGSSFGETFAAMSRKRYAARGANSVRARCGHLRRELLQRREVVEDEEAASVGRDDEVVEMLLDDQAVHRRVRHAELHRLPVIAVVERHVQRVLGAEVQQAAPDRIFADDVRVAQRCSCGMPVTISFHVLPKSFVL